MKTKALVVAATCLNGLLLSIAATHAANGGPDVARVLGWTASEQRVYVEIVHIDESGDPPGVFYFDLKAKTSERAVRVPWSHPDSVLKDSYDRAKAQLMSKLEPLEIEPGPSIPEGTTSSSVDSLDTPWGRWGRQEVRAWFHQLCECTLVATTIKNQSDILVTQVHRIPNSTRRVGIAAFIGKPVETGYEVQVPFLFPERGERVRLEPFSRQ